MIVCCPACRTRYRYQEPVSEPGGQAVCGNCEGLVPLVAAGRAYVLRAEVAAVPARVLVGAAVGTGVDDPGMASSRRTSAFDSRTDGEAPAMAYRVTATEPATEPIDFPFEDPVDASAATVLPAEHAPPEIHPVDDLTLVEVPEVKTQSKADCRAATAAGKKVSGRKGRGAVRRIFELLAIVILTAAGAAAGEYATMVGWLGPVRIHAAVEPVRLGIIGGLLGVLIAWAGIRWTAPKS
jgi:hypothetical protein